MAATVDAAPGRTQGLHQLFGRRGPAVPSWLLDAAVSVVLLVAMAGSEASKAPQHGQRAADIWAYLLTVGLSVPYLWHRRWPLAAVAVCSVATVVYALAQYAAYPGVNMFVLLYAIALHCGRARSLVAVAASVVVFCFALAVQPAGVVTGSTWTSTLLAVAVAWLGGENLRARRARWAAMEERARRLEHEREERSAQAVAAERLRIARELHDVVAHSMSVIAVQSGVGNHVIDSQPAEAKRALAAIETTSRAALVEMRRLLGVLRPDGDDPSALTPTPGLADLPDLVGQVSGAGVHVKLAVLGDRRPLAPGVDLSAYRIVQEALTNVIKHGGAAADVTLAYGPREVSVEVVNSAGGRPGGPAGRPAWPGALVDGHGLVGMRERVAVFGGEFAAGPLPGGGFRVAARLPASQEER